MVAAYSLSDLSSVSKVEQILELLWNKASQYIVRLTQWGTSELRTHLAIVSFVEGCLIFRGSKCINIMEHMVCPLLRGYFYCVLSEGSLYWL